MAEFKIRARKNNEEVKYFYYNNETSSLIDENDISYSDYVEFSFEKEHYFPISSTNPSKKTSPSRLKISLGLSCNYDCEYCCQRFVPRAAETNLKDVENFLNGLDLWITKPPKIIEFWGGEPLVYIKTLKPLAEKLREKYPDTDYIIVTNGSLLTKEINDWLIEMNFRVAISHDGPGQCVRGPDPLEDSIIKEAILDLWNRMKHTKRMSFNSVLNKANKSRKDIQKFFVDLVGEDVLIGEGDLLTPYNTDGMSSFTDQDDTADFRVQSFLDIRNGNASQFVSVNKKITDFINSIKKKRPSYTLHQKCSMDKEDQLTVTLKGDVLTCQNVSIKDIAHNGESHNIGNVRDLSNVKLTTSTHWSLRDECPKCPVLQICKGSCMFLGGEMWERSCNNAFAENIPIFAAGFEYLTGYIPEYIEGPQREDRKQIWLPNPPKNKKIIPIKPIKA
jgi:uncharacterized protein